MGIKVIFQATKDKRVKKFIASEGIEVIELEEFHLFEIEEGYNISIAKDDFYDSSLIIQLNGKKIFNLNDCHFLSERKIKKFKKKYGTCDILLTQFSYAAWKGGEENKKWREDAAYEKLQGIIKQCEILEAKIMVPFASFIWFSNELNKYLNDSANRPSTVALECRKKLKNCVCTIVKPMETLKIDSIYDIPLNTNAIAFWETKFLEPFQIISYYSSVPFIELNKKFSIYCDRVKKNNSRFMITVASKLPFIEVFKPVEVELLDLGLTVKIDVPKHRITISNASPDIALHSQSLAFIFDNSFGFDTLTVNGNFEQKSKSGFSKFTKNFAIENLNNLGYRLDWTIIFNMKLISIFVSKLIDVADKLNENKN